MHRALFVLTALCASAPAFALDTFMWGIGPRIGTNMIPGAYPLKLPATVVSDSAIEQVRTDVFFGFDSAYYLDAHGRTGALGGVGVGKGFTDLHLVLRYEYAARTGPMDFLFGGGVGAGLAWFRSDQDEVLKIPYYPFRANASALMRDNGRGYQLTLFTQYNLPARQLLMLPSVEEQTVKGGVYLTVGVELAVMFGDFTPPKRKSAPADDAT